MEQTRFYLFISELFIADLRFQSGKNTVFFLHRTLISFSEIFIEPACSMNENRM